ncbi:MAG: putative selenium-dependent hydroxylase accessory protein YqeC [Chloroflexi bacterium]|nr:putative selenium-dependent hydroxylase accessory protein YqeC [Chloroflexota bacterium]
MNISRALRLDNSPTLAGSIAFVGAGGKTTAMFQLARELGTRVIVTATTHLGAWQIPLADRHVIAESPAEVGEIPDGVTLVTGKIVEDRTSPVNPSVLYWLHEDVKNSRIPLLIEADGARQKPLKAPAAHEPPIPDFVGTVVVVAGLSGLGKPLSEAVFREEEFGRVSEATRQRVTAEMVTRVLMQREGGLKNIPEGARRVALLNQADTPELQAAAQKMGSELLKKFDAVVVASLKENKVWATYENITGIILAAGESKRFGKPKQLLDWNGKSFVKQVAETALSAGLRPVIVVTGANAEEVENALAGLDVKLVRNEAWKSGQASSIVAGVKSLPQNIGASFFLLADQPQIGADVIHALREVHAQRLSPIIAPLVMEERRANPVLFDRVTFPDLLTLTGDVGGRAIFDKHKVEYLPWYNSELLMDVDSPSDYERLMRQP